MERILPVVGEKKLIEKPVRFGVFILEDAVELSGGIASVENWLSVNVGNHNQEYQYPALRDELNKFLREEHGGSDVDLVRAFRFSLPVEGERRGVGIRNASVLLLTTDGRGFSLVAPDVGVKEAEIVYLAQNREALKPFPLIRMGLAVEKLTGEEQSGLNLRVGKVLKELGERRTKIIWYTLNQELEEGGLKEVLSDEVAEQLKNAWKKLCWNPNRKILLRTEEENVADAYNLPFSGSAIYENPNRPSRLTLSELTKGSTAYKAVYGDVREEEMLLPKETKGGSEWTVWVH